MQDWQRRTAIAIAVSASVILIYAVLYQWGMRVHEARPVSFVRSIQVVVESLVMSGYGGDAPWSSAFMNLLVIALNLTGVVMVFLALPFFILPLFGDAFRGDPPVSFEAGGHVILCPAGPHVEAMIAELVARQHDYVVIEPDLERARALHAARRQVIHGDPELPHVLVRASLSRAAAVVVDAPDDVGTSIILAVREVSPTIPVVSVVDNQELQPYHRLAGANHVLSPRTLVGESLARQTPFLINTDGASDLLGSGGFDLTELIIEPKSELAGRKVSEVQLRQRYGVEIIAAWVDREFTTAVGSDFRLEPRTRLLVAGQAEEIAKVRRQLTASLHPFAERRVIIVGYGRSGKEAGRALADTNVKLAIIDARPQEGVDVVGDARDPAVYEAAGIANATAVIFDLDDDTVELLATLIVRKANPTVYIIAGANAEANVSKLHRAGADYVESLAAVTARMMVAKVFLDEDVLAVQGRIEVVQVGVGNLAGQTLAEARVRSLTGCTVLGVVRAAEPFRAIDPATYVFTDTDRLAIAGSQSSVRRYEETFLS